MLFILVNTQRRFYLNAIQNFNTNVNLEAARFNLMHNRVFKEAKGLTNLKKLKVLTLKYLNTGFILPDRFNTCTRLEDVEFIQFDGQNALKNRKVIQRLLNLKKFVF